jgi:hypothetical protein
VRFPENGLQTEAAGEHAPRSKVADVEAWLPPVRSAARCLQASAIMLMCEKRYTQAERLSSSREQGSECVVVCAGQ